MTPNNTDGRVPNDGSDAKPTQVMRKNSYHPKLLQMPPSKTIDIRFDNITYSVRTSLIGKDRKKVLKGVSGVFKSGELTAIMGPSGAGKSSLLNVLSGFIKEGVGGNLYANGTPVDSQRSQTKQHSAYILQDDYLNPFFTVKEIMHHAADLKLGSSSNHKSKIFLIESILDSMSLAEAGNTYCSRLSGGQKKRLNVCLELIDNPPILFLDEPTSGLDSSSSGLLISELKGMADAGRTVICTIHQPSAAIFYLFDHLHLLSNGQTVYQGDTSNVLTFLECIGLPCPIFHNPADFIMDVVCGEFGDKTDKLIEVLQSKNWRDEVDTKMEKDRNRNILEKTENNNMTIKIKTPSEWQRFKYLVPKLCRHLHRDWTVTYLKIVLHAFIGVLMGLVFSGYGSNGAKVFSNLGYAFTSICFISFTALMPAALKFPSQLKVLKKEHFNNWYKFKTYFFAFMVVNLPIQVFFCFIYVTITYIMTGQPLEMRRYLIVLAACVFSSLLSEFVGLIMGTFGAVNGVFNGSVLLVSMAVHGGFIAFIKDLPILLYLYSFLSFYRYTFEMHVIALYGFGRKKLDCPNEVLYCHLRYTEVLFKQLGFEESNWYKNCIILIFYSIVLAIITYAKLRHFLKNAN